MAANSDLSGAQYMIRGLGYLRSLDDLATVAVANKNGTPVLLRDLGSVTFGPDIREGAADWNGEGETVGGIIVMRQGMNALNVIRGVKEKLREIAPSLPPGVQIVSGYDRSGLIQDSISTLQRDLIEEAIIVSLVIIVFLFHFRSAFIPIIALPIAVLISFLPIYLLGITSNIMSLGGLALAIGVLVDAAIVMVENGYRHLADRQAQNESVSEEERRSILIGSAKQVGPALFFSLLIIVVSFLPVFLLDAQEGRMFRPLAWTKTLAVASSSLLAITLVPLLMVLLIRGRLKPEHKNPISRFTQALYLPVLRFCLRHPKFTIAANLLFLAMTLPIAWHMGSQFMPPLFEGSALYMPTALPGIGIEQARVLLRKQDAILRSFPEVSSVFGAVGRSDSATDNAPLDMYDTTVMLKPRSSWPAGMTYTKLVQQMGCEAAVSRPVEHLDQPGREPPEHGVDRHQNAAGDQSPGSHRGGHRADRNTHPEHARVDAANSLRVCGKNLAGLLSQCKGKPAGSGAKRPQRCRCPGCGRFRHRRQEHCRKRGGARTLPHQRALLAGLP